MKIPEAKPVYALPDGIAVAQRFFDPARIVVALLGRLDGVKLKRANLVC